MIKEGLVFKNTKGNPCVILKVDDKYCWVFAKTRQGFNCNHYGRWYIERQIVTENYPVLADYKNWQEAITRYFANKTDELSEIANMELRDQLEAERYRVKKLENALRNTRDVLSDYAIFYMGIKPEESEAVQKINEVLKC